MLLQEYGMALKDTFQDLGVSSIEVLVQILVAIIIFIAGWIIGSVVGGIVAQIIKALKVDRALESIGTDDLLSRAGFRLDAGAFLGGLVKWFVIVVFLMAAVEVVGLNQVNEFLGRVVAYLPNVIIAVLVLLVAAVISDVVSKMVVGSVKAAKMPSAHFLGGLTKWAIWIFAIFIALGHLDIGTAYFQTLFQGIVIALALSLGLAFGLGGKDTAAKYLDRLRKDISEK